jgi:hypothetical protein
VARAATGNVLDAADVIFLQQRHAQIILIGEALTIDDYWARAGRLLVAHVEYLIARTQILFRRAMAAQTPLHLQRFLLIHQWHLVDWTVAGVAANAFIDVNAVIEKDEVGELVHPRPLQRFSRLVAGADWFEQLRVGPDLRVAVHAGLGGRNASERRSFHARVTVPAIDPVVSNVVLVAELNRLTPRHALIGDVGRSGDDENRRQCNSPKNGHSQQAGSGDKVRTAVKDLCHVRVALERSSSPWALVPPKFSTLIPDSACPGPSATD